MACEILVPHLGIEPTPLAGEAQSLNHWTASEVLTSFEDGADKIFSWIRGGVGNKERNQYGFRVLGSSD